MVIMNSKGKLLLKHGGFFWNGLCFFKKRNKYGALILGEKTIIPFKYDNCEIISDSLLMVKENNKWGLLNFESNILQPAIFDSFQYSGYFEDPSNDFLKILYNNKWGYFNHAGKQITPFVYDSVCSFPDSHENWRGYGSPEDLCIPIPSYAPKNNDSYYSCYSPTTIPQLIFNWAKVSKDRKHGFIDKSGREVIQVIYDKAEHNSENLNEIYVEKDGKKFYIDLNGNFVREYHPGRIH